MVQCRQLFYYYTIAKFGRKRKKKKSVVVSRSRYLAPPENNYLIKKNLALRRCPSLPPPLSPSPPSREDSLPCLRNVLYIFFHIQANKSIYIQIPVGSTPACTALAFLRMYICIYILEHLPRTAISVVCFQGTWPIHTHPRQKINNNSYLVHNKAMKMISGPFHPSLAATHLIVNSAATVAESSIFLIFFMWTEKLISFF